MDESRKQFVEIYEQMKHDRFGSNEEWAWKFWVASRAAIEIDLPDELTIEDCIDKDIDVCRATHFNLGMGKLEQAIRAAGIKVKE